MRLVFSLTLFHSAGSTGGVLIHLHIRTLQKATKFHTRTLLWDRWDGVRERKEKGHKRSLDDLLNQHCPTQVLADLGCCTNNWVQNECIQHPQVQCYTDAM